MIAFLNKQEKSKSWVINLIESNKLVLFNDMTKKYAIIADKSNKIKLG
jgi:hypothetical protein